MKYYKLIDNNPKNWPSFTVGKIYRADYESKERTTVRVWANAINGHENWQEVPESEYLLQEAKERYPKGTKFHSAYSQGKKVSTGEFKQGVYEYGITTDDNYVYFEGKWAEIISKPKQENKEMEEFKITKEQVILIAKHSTKEGQEKLRELFPDVLQESYLQRLGKRYKTELHLRLLQVINNGTTHGHGNKIPGETDDEKAESIAKLIYETWIKE